MTHEGVGNGKSSEQVMSARVVVGKAHYKADSGDWQSEGYALIGVVPNGLFEGFFETPEAARAELISKGWEEVHSNVRAAWELPFRQDELSEGLLEKRERRNRRVASVQKYVARAFSEDGIRLYEIIVYDEHGHALPAHEQPMRPFLIIEGGRVVLAMTKAEAAAGFKHYLEMIKGRNLKSRFSNKFK